MALENMDLKTKNWSHLGKKEKHEEEEEEEKKRKRRSSQASQGMELWIFVWKPTLIMELNGSMEL